MNPLKRKASLFFFSSLACFTWSSSVCFSLPSKPVAKSGAVNVEYVDSHTMYIKASDNAILHYDDFQIDPGELVHFIQSVDSCVIHHVVGNQTSQIAGSIYSAGKVVLVSSGGISVGETGKVETGSLILSTLEVMDADVSLFSLSQQKSSSILNKGALLSQEGSIVLLAPDIRNLGSIDAKRGSVVMGSAENATWNGESLSVQGCVEDALIEQRGSIQASAVVVKLPVRTQSITNQDESHEMFIETDGEIVFAKDSQIKAQTILVEGSHISIQGSVDATDALDQGGTVHLFGSDISLGGAKIDVSGLRGGGEVLIGGELQGKGITPYALKVHMDESSEIYASAIQSGNGGLVVLWSQAQTIFHGSIESSGGVLGGNGGLIETSSRGKLDVAKGLVEALAPKGQLGEWLLDPTYLNIVSDAYDPVSGYGDCNTDTYMDVLDTNKFKDLKSNITIMAHTGITVYDSIKVTGKGVVPNVTFKTCASGGGFLSIGDVLSCNKSISITTDGGSILLDNINFCYLQCPTTTFETQGGNLTLNSLIQTSTCYNTGAPPQLSIDAGKGEVVVSTVITEASAEYPYLQGSITIHHAGVVKTQGLYINGSLNMSGIPLLVYGGGDRTIKTNGHKISIGSVGIASGYSGSIHMSAGSSSTITVGTIGGSEVSGMVSPTSFTIGANEASSVSLTHVTTQGGDISILSPVMIQEGSVLTANGGNIYLGSTTTAGSISLDKNVTFTNGGIVQGNFVIGGDAVFDNPASLTGSFSTAASMSFSGTSVLNGTFVAETGISFASSLSIAGTTTLKSSSGISIGSQIDSNGSGSYDLTLEAGTSPITIGGDVANLHSFTITSASEIALFNVSVTGGQASIPCAVIFQDGGGVISTQGGDIFLSNTVYPSNPNISVDLIMNTTSSIGTLGSISLQGAGDFSYPFRSISLTGSSITLGQTSTLIAANGPLYLSGALYLSGNTLLKGSKGITFDGDVTFAVSNLDLTLDSGIYALTLPSLGSVTSPLGNLSITASNLILGGDLYASSSIGINAGVIISANTVLSSLSGKGGIIVSGPVTTSSDNPNLTLQANSGPLDIQSLGSVTYPLGDLFLTGSYMTVNGDITSAGSMNLSGTITTTQSLTLSAVQGITLHQDLVPNTNSLDLTLQATGGTVVAQNLGTDTNPLKNISMLSAGSLTPKSLISTGDISLSGTTITLGSTMSASGTITIANTDLLTIPSGSMNLSGDFSQTGSGNVSLGMSMVTSGSIGFAGDVTLTGSTTLQGTKGITISGTLAPSSGSPSLTLDSGTNPLTVKFASSESNPFGALAIIASNLILQGDVYSNTSITIDPPISISSDTIFDSLSGYGGVLLLGPITASSGNPSLIVKAAKGPADVDQVGSKTLPLGDVSITGGTYIHLGGDIVSLGPLELSGSVTITDSRILVSAGGITLNNDVTPSVAGLNLTLQTSNQAISTQNLGKSDFPLQTVSLTCSVFDLLGSMTASAATFNGATCSSGNWPSGTYTSCPGSVR